jgi:hypothetical protein
MAEDGEAGGASRCRVVLDAGRVRAGVTPSRLEGKLEMCGPNPLLSGYWPSECRAIMVCKYFMGLERGYDPPLPEVIDIWERDYAPRWRANKLQRDAQAQVREIEGLRQRLAAERGGDVDFKAAAREWVSRYEASWRAAWEDTAAAGA